VRTLAEALQIAEGTRGRIAKAEAIGKALRETPRADLAFAARLVTGALLPSDDDRTLGAGGALVFDTACAVTGATPEALGQLTLRAGDLGTAVGQALEAAARSGPGLSFAEAREVVETLASSGSRERKREALEHALGACTPLEARYFVRALLGEMRVGAQEGLAQDAVARAFGRPLAEVRRAAQLVTDIGVVAELAHDDRLGEARVVLGRPVAFMLATPIESAKGADLSVPHAVEDKIDGIRAQAHVTPDGVHLFARGTGPVTRAFPDVTRPLEDAKLPPAILDGEIVVIGEGGRPRPFSALQPRLNKRDPDEALLAGSPVRYLAYDLLYEDGEVLLDRPFTERRARLAAWAGKAPSPLVLHDSRTLGGETAVEPEFTAARARGYEGLVLKRMDAPYQAGVRGFSWLKVKKALATLDCVVVAAERGHGKRAGVLSDYTFAVWDGGELVPVGKAYSGLTDAEIKAMTARLEAIATAPEERGWIPVEPEVVLEVAFDGIQRSTRHASGFALRFPRIARIRDDKRPEEADTLDAVRALFESQVASGHREDVEPPKKKGGRRSGRRPDVRKKSKQLKLFDD
jgi:DNA ligase-1